MEGRQDLPAPALDPGPVEAAGSRVSCTPAPRSGFLWPPSDPTPACPRPPVLPHHAQNTVCLALQWLWQGWNVHTLGHSHCPSIKISYNHIQLWTEGSERSESHGPVSRAWSSPAWSSEADAEQGPHQLLGLCLEGSVDSDDEGCGRAEHLQELRRQDGHVRETATGQGSARQPEGQGGAEGLRGSGQR